MSAVASDFDDYSPDACDLCGSTDYHEVLRRHGRVMTSDSRIVAGNLVKVQCDTCGLVRSGAAIDSQSLEELYVERYQLALTAESAEPVFQTPQGPVARSEAIARWIVEGYAQTGKPTPHRVLDVGCSEGRVLTALRKAWPDASLVGLEPNAAAADQARRRGVDILEGGYQSATGSYDLVYSVAVLEHVPSPSHFVDRLVSLLASDGVLLLMQPCQEDLSHDLLFMDHLHHFYLPHVAWLGAKKGLSVVAERLRNPLLPHFSMHVFSGESSAVASFESNNDFHERIAENVRQWTARFERLDGWLSATPGADLYVWGVGEFFTLLKAYTRFGSEIIAGAFDNNLARYRDAGFNFSVALPPDDLRLVKGRLLLTFKTNDALKQRIEAAALPWFSPLVD
jgi:SAM-dependent methyltransferase